MGDGVGWFVDGTPTGYSEFTNLTNSGTNAYAADAPSGNAGYGQEDLMTAVVLRMTNAVGIASNSTLLFQTGGFLINTNVADTTAEDGNAGYFWTFQGPSGIHHLMTSSDAGVDMGAPVHSAPSGTSVVSGGFTYQGAEDAGNNKWETGRRYMVPKTMGLILQDAYGYTIAQQPSFYHGGCIAYGSPSADTIILTRTVGNILTSSVDLGTDVPGTGLAAGAGDAGPFVTVSDVSGGCSGANYPTVWAETGNDTITVDGGSFRIYAHGENGNDVISNTGTSAGYLYGEVGADSITSLSSNDFIYGDVGNDTIWAGGGADFVDGGDDADSIEGQAGNDSLYGGIGNDTINGGNDDDYIEGGLGADLMHGNGGNDQFQANDGTGTDTMFGDGGADTLLGSNPGDVFTQ